MYDEFKTKSLDWSDTDATLILDNKILSLKSTVVTDVLLCLSLEALEIFFGCHGDRM